METDSLMLRLALGRNAFSLAPTGGPILHLILYFSVLYCSRVSNSVAHVLASQIAGGLGWELMIYVKILTYNSVRSKKQKKFHEQFGV